MRAIRHLLHLSRARWLLAALLVALLLPSGQAPSSPGRRTARRPAAGDRRARCVRSLPLAFESNEGQGDPAARFLAHGHGYTLALAPDALTLCLPTPLRFTFPGANPSPALRAEQPLPGVVNSFIGNDPSRWRTAISTTARVRYTDLSPASTSSSTAPIWRVGDDVWCPRRGPGVLHPVHRGATGMTLDAATATSC